MWIGLLFTLVALAQTGDRSAVPVAQPPSTEERWAIIVGIDDYRADGLAPLQFAVADAREIAETLKESQSFPSDHVILLTSDEVDPRRQPTPQNVRAELSRLQGLAPASVVFYFSGHGFSRPATSSTSTRSPKGQAPPRDEDLLVLQPRRSADQVNAHALAPRDADAPPTLRVEEVVDLLAATGARQRVLFIDACRNPGTRSGGTTGMDPAVFNRAGTWALLCGSQGQVCEERDGHGVFTRYLLEALRGGADGNGGQRDHLLMSAELWFYVNNAMSGNKIQNPSQGGSAPDLPIVILPQSACESSLGLTEAMATASAVPKDDPVALMRAVDCAEEALGRENEPLRAARVRDLFALLAAREALRQRGGLAEAYLRAARSLAGPDWPLPDTLGRQVPALWGTWYTLDRRLVKPTPQTRPEGWPEGVRALYNGGAGALFAADQPLPNVVQVIYPGRVVRSTTLQGPAQPLSPPTAPTHAERTLPARRALIATDLALAGAAVGLGVAFGLEAWDVRHFQFTEGTGAGGDVDRAEICAESTRQQYPEWDRYCSLKGTRNTLGTLTSVSAALLATGVSLTFKLARDDGAP